jgi:hypothetical protein
MYLFLTTRTLIDLDWSFDLFLRKFFSGCGAEGSGEILDQRSLELLEIRCLQKFLFLLYKLISDINLVADGGNVIILRLNDR